MPYLCRISNTTAYESCSEELICEILKTPGVNLDYIPNKNASGYLNNWYVENKMICLDQSLRQPAKMFFIGYFFGVVLIFFPEVFGRKKALNIILPFSIIGMSMIYFGQDMK